MKTFNVLSIDWDYFMLATASLRAEVFPDGGNENLHEDILAMVWGCYYAGRSAERLKAIGTSVKEKRAVIRTAKDTPSLMVADSHRFAYEFIKSENLMALPVNLVNIDFHHDIYWMNEGVDCGNWLRHTIEESEDGSRFLWLRREDSAMPEEDDEVAKRLESTTDIGVLKGQRWDAVYLCRSGLWSPPHLDRQFATFANSLARGAERTVLERGILKDRMPSTQKAAKIQEEILALSLKKPEEPASNRYYELADGFCTQYVNTKTGEKKFALEDGDILVSYGTR